MSCQEAVYHVLSLPLSKSSRASVFVNTSLIDERIEILKPKSQLAELDPDSKEIMADSILSLPGEEEPLLNSIC